MTQEISRSWAKFFDSATPLAERAALLENGDRLQPLLQGFSSDPSRTQVKAEVTRVELVSADTADITYTLTLQEKVVLPDASGKAVRQHGTWKVADATLCALIAQGGASAVAGCG